MQPEPDIMIIAGEASGDHHGAKVVSEMKKKRPSLSFYGVGGPALEKAGVHILVKSETLSVVGITEVFSKALTLLKAISRVKRFLKQKKPDLLILIDFPDFNLHIAGYAKKQKIPVLYYISPQIWAWRSGRVKKIEKRVNHMAVILPFEKTFYQNHRVRVTFVGHPLLDDKYHSDLIKNNTSDHTVKKAVVGLLPGSRDKEVEKLLPEMLGASQLLAQKYDKLDVLLSCAPSIQPDVFQSIVRQYEQHCGKIRFHLRITHNLDEIFRKATVLIAGSGTVTLQAAIAGVPMVIIYKVSPVSYRLGKALINVKFISLVNLISEKEVVRELIQNDASAFQIASTVSELIDNPLRLRSMRNQLLEIRKQLGLGGASAKVAQIALTMLRNR